MGNPIFYYNGAVARDAVLNEDELPAQIDELIEDITLLLKE